ncbi:hypothetical protein E1176_10825 [Fulvivirga sp. RKSG066]|uniref:hypothetical protein n=1 Tax=Fulvivirga aurantia TaxID=2529383 RepID=UPI0012BCBCDF|nr:hypothetical protein [Fulvivirga aurantia]MTI21512.1 hypothetical protein [Fulvivirga aurantia]
MTKSIIVGNIFLALSLALGLNLAYGQNKIDTITLAQGEVMDILLIEQKQHAEEALKSYFETVIPIGRRMNYRPLPGFKIVDHTKGNLCPTYLILAKWDNLQSRQGFLNNITDEVPDFHERRREIWSYFGTRYYEMGEDHTLTIDRSKFHIATAYWLDDDSNVFQDWEQKVRKMGGELLITLTGGTSPLGYRYDPNYFVITAWKNEASFAAFQKEIAQLAPHGVQHVNEFILK